MSKKARWTAEEIEILRQYYPTMGGEVYTLLPNRKKANCMYQANRLNISVCKERLSEVRRLALGINKEWTTKEQEILRKYYPTMGAEGIHENKLLDRTISAIHSRALVLELSYYKKTHPLVKTKFSHPIYEKANAVMEAHFEGQRFEKGSDEYRIGRQFGIINY